MQTAKKKSVKLKHVVNCSEMSFLHSRRSRDSLSTKGKPGDFTMQLSGNAQDAQVDNISTYCVG